MTRYEAAHLFTWLAGHRPDALDIVDVGRVVSGRPTATFLDARDRGTR